MSNLDHAPANTASTSLAKKDDTETASLFTHPEAATAVAEWLSGLGSEHTRAAYRQDLGLFATWLREMRGHTDLTRVTLADMSLYVRDRREAHGDSRKTISRRLSTVSAMFRRLRAVGLITTNPADPDAVSRPKGAADRPTAWTETHDMEAILTTADERDTRSSLLVRLLALSGLRVSEVMWLRMRDVDDGPQGCVLHVRGKGDTASQVEIDQDTCDVLARWLDERAERMRRAGLDPHDPSGALIVGRHGTPVARQTLADVIGTITKRAVGHRLTPHSLRKSAAIALHRAGHSNRDLQKFGRWETQATVSTYVNVADDTGHPGLVMRDVIRRGAAQPRTARRQGGRLRRPQNQQREENS